MRRVLMIAVIVGFSLFGLSASAFAQHGLHGGFHGMQQSHHHHGGAGGFYGGYPSGHGGYTSGYGLGYPSHGHAHAAPYAPYGGYGGYSAPYQQHGGLQIVTPGFGLSIGGHHHH